MHIPDGYLGPATCAAGYAAMVPLWTAAGNKVKKSLEARQVPLLAIGAAFTFLIMMFNVPLPGGTTGHAVGGVLVAILLGPWAAVIAVSIALAVQAFLFGDGGITAYGANCLNMAVVLPFAGYYTYKLLAGKSAPSSRRRMVAAGIGGYVGLCLAAALAGAEFGLQPLLHHSPDGHSLYCPYGLSAALPAMLGGHALIFGWVEALVTALVMKYLQQYSPELLEKETRP
jgi:cobalt/nickel transport system permease protein